MVAAQPNEIRYIARVAKWNFVFFRHFSIVCLVANALCARSNGSRNALGARMWFRSTWKIHTRNRNKLRGVSFMFRFLHFFRLCMRFEMVEAFILLSRARWTHIRWPKVKSIEEKKAIEHKEKNEIKFWKRKMCRYFLNEWIQRALAPRVKAFKWGHTLTYKYIFYEQRLYIFVGKFNLKFHEWNKYSRCSVIWNAKMAKKWKNIFIGTGKI